MKKYIIKSLERANSPDIVAAKNCYFVAYHSYTNFYGKAIEAGKFKNFNEAYNYAMRSIFTNNSVFEIEEIEETV